MNAASPSRTLLAEFPASIMQRRYLVIYSRPESTIQTRLGPILQLAFKVSPALTVRKLERAVEGLWRRHDSLRMSFALQGASWRARIWDRPNSGVEIVECQDLARSGFEELLDKAMARNMDPVTDDLFRIMVFRGVAGGDVLLVRAHHAVTDGNSLLLLAEELIKRLIGIPVVGKAASQEDYLRQVETLPVSRKREIDAYWQRVLYPVLPAPGVSDFGTGMPTPIRIFSGEHCATLERAFDRRQYERLPEALGLGNVTCFALVLAAFAKSMLELSGLPGIYAITYVDRIAGGLRDFAGNALQFMPLRLERPADPSLAGYARVVGEALTGGLAHLPSDAGSAFHKHDLAIHAAGGALCHIHCGEVFQSRRARSSAFGSAMETPIGVARKLGPITLTQLNVPIEGFSPNGIDLMVRRDAESVLIELRYHRNLFPDANMARLYDRLVATLGLEKLALAQSGP